MLHKTDGSPIELSTTEWIGLLTLAYLTCVATFNAGYFSQIPSRFDVLFSFSDLLGCHSACNFDPLSGGIGVQN